MSSEASDNSKTGEVRAKMSWNVRLEFQQSFIKIREYKKQILSMTSSFEKLSGMLFSAEANPSIRDIVAQMFSYEENNEFIHIALISCLNKVLKYAALEQDASSNRQIDASNASAGNGGMLTRESISTLSGEDLLDIIKAIDSVTINPTTEGIFALKSILEMPTTLLSTEVFETIWNVLWQTELNPDVTCKEYARDTLFASLLSYTSHTQSPNNSSSDSHRVSQVFELLKKKIEKELDAYQKPTTGKQPENWKTLELSVSLLIFAIQQLSTSKQLQTQQEFLERTLPFLLSRLSRIENVGIYMKVLQCFEIVFEIYSNLSSGVEDIIQSRFVFGQVILTKLKQSVKRVEEKELPCELLSLMYFLRQFLSSQRNILQIFQKNDMIFQNQPVLKETIAIIIDLSKNKTDKNEDIRIIADVASDILLNLLVIKPTKLTAIQESPQENEQVEAVAEKRASAYKQYTAAKSKWEDLSTTFNESSKNFLKKIAAEKSVNDFKNLDEESIAQVVRFLRTFHNVNQKHMIEVIGGSDKFHNKCLKTYMKTFNFSSISILEATRIVFSTFLMTGESQQVLRFLEEFSQTFFDNNQSLFVSNDSTYTYITALMMLHSDLHNENNERKMTQDQFIKQVSGINGKGTEDLPRSFVLECYSNIQKEQIRECRNYHTSPLTTEIVWNYLHQEKQFNFEVNTISYLEPELISIEDDQTLYEFVAESAMSDLILSSISENIDQIIMKFADAPESSVEAFIQQLVTLCVNMGRQSQIDIFFNSFNEKAKVESIAEHDERSIQYLHCCFVLASKALRYLDSSRQNAINLIVKTTKLRSCLVKDSVATRINAFSKLIRESNDFYEKNKHNNKSFLDIFSKFLEQEDQEDDTQEAKAIEVAAARVPLEVSAGFAKRFKADNYVERILEATLLLKDKEYEEMVNGILSELQGDVPFSKRTHTFTHLINICIEIMKINAERVEKVWEKICILLKLGFSKEKVTDSNPLLLQIDNVKIRSLIFSINSLSVAKKNKKTFLHSFSQFSLLELCITHMHLCDKFNSFDDCLADGLNYLDDSSLQLVEEFNKELKTFILSSKLHNSKAPSHSQALKVIWKLLKVLEGKNLDKKEVVDNCIVLQDSIENFVISTTNIEDSQGYLAVITPTMKLLEEFIGSKIFAVLKAEIWMVQTLQIIFSQQDKRTEEANSCLYLGICNLTSSMKEWNNENTEIFQSVLQSAIGQINFSIVNEEFFRQLFEKVRFCQNKILVLKNKAAMSHYINTISSLFKQWITKERFSLDFIIGFLVNLAEMHKFAFENQLREQCADIQAAIINSQLAASSVAPTSEDVTKIAEKLSAIVTKYAIIFNTTTTPTSPAKTPVNTVQITAPAIEPVTAAVQVPPTVTETATVVTTVPSTETVTAATTATPVVTETATAPANAQ